MTKKNENHPLIKEIDNILLKQGRSFDSAIREYRVTQMDLENTDNERVNDKKWVDRFKKYRSRISSNTKSKPYAELLKLKEFFESKNIIKAAPLLHLVDDPKMDEIMKKLSKKIKEEINCSEQEL